MVIKSNFQLFSQMKFYFKSLKIKAGLTIVFYGRFLFSKTKKFEKHV